MAVGVEELSRQQQKTSLDMTMQPTLLKELIYFDGTPRPSNQNHCVADKRDMGEMT